MEKQHKQPIKQELVMKQPKQSPDGKIFVGDKPMKNYITAVMTQAIGSNLKKDILICGRGKFISKAVSIAEMVRNKQLKGKYDVKDYKSQTEPMKTRSGKKMLVTSIEAVLSPMVILN